MAITLTVTPELDSVPPRMRINVVDNSPTPVASVVVNRLDPDGRTRKVRTSNDAALTLSAGAAVVYDPEIPYGSDVLYSATGAASVPARLDVEQAWLTHPGRPSLSMPVEFRRGSFTSEDWALDQGVFNVLGRSAPVVVTGGARTTAAGAFTVGLESLSDLASMRNLIADGLPLLLNVSPVLGWGIDSTYIAIGGVRVTRPSDVGTEQLRDVEMTYQVVERPIGGTQPGTTWADIAAHNTTWLDVAASAGSWLDLASPSPDVVAVYPATTLYPAPDLYPGR